MMSDCSVQCAIGAENSETTAVRTKALSGGNNCSALLTGITDQVCSNHKQKLDSTRQLLHSCWDQHCGVVKFTFAMAISLCVHIHIHQYVTSSSAIFRNFSKGEGGG